MPVIYFFFSETEREIQQRKFGQNWKPKMCVLDSGEEAEYTALRWDKNEPFIWREDITYLGTGEIKT